MCVTPDSGRQTIAPLGRTFCLVRSCKLARYVTIFWVISQNPMMNLPKLRMVRHRERSFTLLSVRRLINIKANGPHGFQDVVLGHNRFQSPGFPIEYANGAMHGECENHTRNFRVRSHQNSTELLTAPARYDRSIPPFRNAHKTMLFDAP
jgi:hypothetical protein